jgi:hypothetical protein
MCARSVRSCRIVGCIHTHTNIYRVMGLWVCGRGCEGGGEMCARSVRMCGIVGCVCVCVAVEFWELYFVHTKKFYSHSLT